MTKEQIKFLIDNEQTIFDEIFQKLENLGEKIDIPNFNSIGDIRNFYDYCYKHCSDILYKYNFDFDAFKTVISIYIESKSFREQILGEDKANQLLRDIIDIYGDKACEILNCNSDKFKMSDINGILSGENNQKYQEFYIKLLNRKCEQVFYLEQLSDILLSARPEYINQKLIEKFLKNPDIKIYDFSIRKFIDTAPSVIINGNTVKALVNRLDNITDTSILEEIPPELFDADFSRRLLEKSDRGFYDVFSIIPEHVKDKEMWEYAISRESDIIYSLPDQKIDENMTDEKYSEWCNKLVVDVIRKNPDNIQEIFNNLRDSQKTMEVCVEGANLLKTEDENVKMFLEKIPEVSRSRQMYEALLQKSEDIIKEIPSQTFEEGLSQEEYETWLNDIITKKILELEDTDKLLYYSIIPREKMTERVWNAIIDKCNEKDIDKSKFDLSSVPIQNITIGLCERALKEFGTDQLTYLPSIDKKIDLISDDILREEYEKWIESFSEKEKQEYREWYEEKIIDFIKTKESSCFIGGVHIPLESITINIINTSLQVMGPSEIKNIPVPNEFTNYNQQYEDIILSTISMLEERIYEENIYEDTRPKQEIVENCNILEMIPKEYRTDKVIMEAIKKHPKYLKYVDVENENFEELLQIGYRNKLHSMGRKRLSEKEIELIKRFAKNNSNLFFTINIDILNPEIISVIGENSIERIVRYKDLQEAIIKLAKDKDALTTFGFALENLKQDRLFIEPLIEQLNKTIIEEETESYNVKIHGYEKRAGEFLKLASSRIQDSTIPLTEEEKTIISYLVLNPQEANKIKNYDQILNFVENKNAELDEVINSHDVTLIDAKKAYVERIVGMDYDSVIDLIKKYGNDPEQLLTKYEGKELETYNEKSEKESLEIIIKLKSLVQENDLYKIKRAYQEAVEKEDKTKSFKRYKQSLLLDDTLRRAYGRDIAVALSNHDKENCIEYIEHTEEGQEYIVRKVKRPFKRMISVLDAYRKKDDEVEGDMYDRWNTSAMAENHALCYSFINESNPGTAMLGDKKGIVVSISGFNVEAVTAAAPYDLCSDSRKNTTETDRQQCFYTADNLPDQTRGRYSEFVIEIQDVSEGVTEYKKIQPTSIICFEVIDEDSINASIELSKKVGKTIPVELIDRRELASQTRAEIDELLKQFKSGESLQPELVEEIITRFNNVRNAHMDSSLADELLGEKKGKENPEALFNKAHLNEMLFECIEVVKQTIEKGQIQEGLQTIEQIKQFIKAEREKNKLMPTMYEKQIMSGIDLNIDYSLDEIQREYGSQEIFTEAINESFELLQANDDLSSPTYEIMYGKDPIMPEQLSFSEFYDSIDISGIQNVTQEIHQKGYYSRNQSYSEEHIVRVAMFANAIANLEGQDNKTKQLLGEAVKFYSSGRMLDITEEQHQEYSAKIAGKEIAGKYSKTDVGIIQAAIELQNLKYTSSTLDEKEKEKERTEKIIQLCSKYGLNVEDGKRIDIIATYISDAVVLDKARFVIKTDNPPGEQFDFYSLKTNTAKRLVKSSYCIQDRLSTEHLKEMAKVAHIDYETEKDTIMKEFFTKPHMLTTREIFDKSIIQSPIVQEEYFKHKYREIINPVEMGREIGKIQMKMQTRTTAEMPVYTEQQIGQATINTPTTSKDEARNRQARDEKQLTQMIERR